MKISLKLFYLLLPLAMLSVSCMQRSDYKFVSFVGEAQGTYYLVSYYDQKGRNLQPQVDSLLKAFDMSVSLWEPNSILSRINRGDTTVVPDEVFLYNFNLSKEVAEATGGAFDFTIAPLVKAWGFGPRGRAEITPQLIDSLKALVDYRRVHLQNGTVVKEDPRLMFDFNAVAQGHSVDLLAQLLLECGITHFLVDVGGEIYAHNRKPDGSNWRVGIERPAETQDDERAVEVVINLENMAIATSGNYRKYYERDGMRFSHTIDPRTGYPVEHNLLSVTVLAENAALADAYATAFMVMGYEGAIALIETTKAMEAYLIWSGHDGGFEVYASEGLSELITE